MQVRGAAPTVRVRVIGELLQHVLATHANVVVEQLGGLSKGSSLQVCLGQQGPLYCQRACRQHACVDPLGHGSMALNNMVMVPTSYCLQMHPLQLLLELAFFKESLEAFLQPPITTMFATSEDILAARFQKGLIAGGPGGKLSNLNVSPSAADRCVVIP